MIGITESMRNARGDRGFTLVELMVVVGLLVIFGLLFTSFDTQNWLANYKLRGAARDMYAQMQKARMNAIKENRAWGILFDTATDTYQLQFQDDLGNWVNSSEPAVTLPTSYQNGTGYGYGAATIGADGAAFSGQVTFGGVAGQPTQFRATFTPQGLASNGYCYLANNENDAYAVGCFMSGAVRMRKWNGTAWQ